MDKTQQGDIGFAAANLHYRIEGAKISAPLTEQIKYDMIIDRGNGLERVQIKTTGYKADGVSYEVGLRTNGANYTTKNNHTKISSDSVDIVFVLCMNGDCYEFPVEVVSGKSALTLGKKYENYLVRRIGGLFITKNADIV